MPLAEHRQQLVDDLRLIDAHLHLQEPELKPLQDEIRACWTQLGLVRAVVNGTCEADWPAVQALAGGDSRILPAYGLHPWLVKTRSSDWLANLEACLDRGPSVVGEIGIDHHVPDRDDADQEAVFLAQLELGCRRDLPVTIHCVKAWGRLEALLRDHRDRLPRRGFLLHAYGGPAEMVSGLADLGAWFSFSSHAGHERAARSRQALQSIPLDRLLIETDAPALAPPPEWTEIDWIDPTSGRRLNHPANIIAGYRCVAGVLEMKVEALAAQVEANFTRLFGPIPT